MCKRNSYIVTHGIVKWCTQKKSDRKKNTLSKITKGINEKYFEYLTDDENRFGFFFFALQIWFLPNRRFRLLIAALKLPLSLYLSLCFHKICTFGKTFSNSIFVCLVHVYCRQNALRICNNQMSTE